MVEIVEAPALRSRVARTEPIERVVVIEPLWPYRSTKSPCRALDDEELGPSQTPLDEIVEDSAPCPGAFAAHALDREHTFWPSSRTPIATSSEMEVALRSSRTRTTVPSRMSRTIGSSASKRAFQASQGRATVARRLGRDHPLSGCGFRLADLVACELGLAAVFSAQVRNNGNASPECTA
jgi:hypothetical protein